jgi:predicted AlkP superfamily pyrophosphatase or phosphodiesterase
MAGTTTRCGWPWRVMIGDVLEAIEEAGLRDSITIIVVGDDGFATIHTMFRPNMLIKDVPAKFVAAGGSAFLYPQLTSVESG